MAKSQVEVHFTLPIDETQLHHKTDAEYKAKETFVLGTSYGKVTSVQAKQQNFLTYRDGISQT